MLEILNGYELPIYNCKRSVYNYVRLIANFFLKDINFEQQIFGLYSLDVSNTLG